MCGEHTLMSSTQLKNEGSSPHVRGARRNGISNYRPAGIIPACAGSTIIGEYFIEDNGDHPRMCGEHFTYRDGLTTLQGSSPHVRGAQIRAWADTLKFGIIPACAGSTRSARPSPSAPRDHPRMCGEHAVVGNLTADPEGSSPHVRGAQCQP